MEDNRRFNNTPKLLKYRHFSNFLTDHVQSQGTIDNSNSTERDLIVNGVSH